MDIHQHLVGHFGKEAPPPLVTAVPVSRRSCVGDAALRTEEQAAPDDPFELIESSSTPDESDAAAELKEAYEPDEAYAYATELCEPCELGEAYAYAMELREAYAAAPDESPPPAEPDEANAYPLNEAHAYIHIYAYLYMHINRYECVHTFVYKP